LQKARSPAAEHRFGGQHTDDKVARLRAFLQSFTRALKHQGFVLIYIDAFAGSGDRTDVIPVLPLLDGDNADPQIVNVPGSARLAIEVTPSFDRLVLIENDAGRHGALDQLRAEFPERDIVCHHGDANDVVQSLCRVTPWRGTGEKGIRGVIFLDPYGMEVEWATVASIAMTRALDLWYFFPLMGLYRQAANEVVAIDAKKRARLTRVLGTEEWEREWYGMPHGSTDLSMIGRHRSARPTLIRSNVTSNAGSRRNSKGPCSILCASTTSRVPPSRRCSSRSPIQARGPSRSRPISPITFSGSRRGERGRVAGDGD
jgi:three-Cys-motif partner protein